jgi:hypothetical protein
VKHRAEEGKKALASRHGEKSGEITQDQDQDDQVLVSVPIRASSQINQAQWHGHNGSGYAGMKEHGLERFARAFAEAGFVRARCWNGKLDWSFPESRSAVGSRRSVNCSCLPLGQCAGNF